MNGTAWFVAIAGATLAPLAWWVAAGARRPVRIAATVAALAACAALYLSVGAPDRIAPPLDPVDDLAARIEQRLDAAPTDAEGWRMLGRLRLAQGKADLAADAYAKARALGGDGDVAALLGYAEARLLGDPERLTGELAPLFERALELAPQDQRALWYGGHLANERGDRALAEQRWRALLAQELPPDLRHAVEMQLGGGAAPEAAALFEIEVVLAPALAARVPPDATLFVFVRVGEGRMPLVVRRLQAPRFPLVVPLGAGDLLADPAALDAAQALTAGARISLAGEAAPRPGDLQGLARIERGAPGRVRVVIDAVLP